MQNQMSLLKLKICLLWAMEIVPLPTSLQVMRQLFLYSLTRLMPPLRTVPTSLQVLKHPMRQLFLYSLTRLMPPLRTIPTSLQVLKRQLFLYSLTRLMPRLRKNRNMPPLISEGVIKLTPPLSYAYINAGGDLFTTPHFKK